MPASVVGNPVVSYSTVTLHRHVSSLTVVDDTLLLYEIIEVVDDAILVSNLSTLQLKTIRPSLLSLD